MATKTLQAKLKNLKAEYAEQYGDLRPFCFRTPKLVYAEAEIYHKFVFLYLDAPSIYPELCTKIKSE
ncbi:MAG: hypothetical protein MHPSP_003564, partial [Paramarteilia canceri]